MTKEEIRLEEIRSKYDNKKRGELCDWGYMLFNREYRTFREIAMLCMKKFKVPMYTNESTGKFEYVPSEVRGYELAIKAAEKKIATLKTFTDEQFYKSELDSIERNKKRIEIYIEKMKNEKARLTKFNQKATALKSPSPEHDELIKFIIDVTDFGAITIDTSKQEQTVLQMEESIKNIDPKKLREDQIKNLEAEIRLKKEMIEDTIQENEKQKEWVEAFLNVLGE